MNFIKKNPSIVVGLGIIILSIFLFNLLGGMKEEPKQSKRNQNRLILLSEIVQRETIPVSIEAFGRIRSVAPIQITSEVSGTVERGNLDFLPGQEFRKGDLLVKIDDRQAKLDLLTAKSQLLNALSTLLPEIKIEFPEAYNTWQTYFDQFNFAGSLKDLPEPADPKIKLYLARYNVYQLFYSAQNLAIRYNKHFFRAPFDGVVITSDLRPGSNARQGSILGQIIKTTDLEVEVPLPTVDLQWIEQNDQVQIYYDGKRRSFTGVVVRFGKKIDTQTETIPIYIRTNKAPKEIADGQFVRIEFPPRNIPKAFIVPEKALYDNNYVYKIKNGRLAKVAVEVLHMEKESVIIGSGPAENDTLIVQTLQGVAPGMFVTARFDGGKE